MTYISFFLNKNIKNMKMFVFNIFFRPNLFSYFKICGTEKYKEAYNALSAIIDKNKISSILEIGIGGHNEKYSGGNSLLALKKYFKNATIIGADIIDKSFLNSQRIKTIKIDQNNEEKLDLLGKKYGKFDIIIDDGSHFVHHQKKTFLTLFKFLNNNGFYIIEDTNSSYRRAYGGSPDLTFQKNIISFLQKFVHSVNSKLLYKKQFYKLKEFIHIDKFFFFPGIIILQKKIKTHLIADYKFLNQSLNKLNKFHIKTKGVRSEKNIKGYLERARNL